MRGFPKSHKPVNEIQLMRVLLVAILAFVPCRAQEPPAPLPKGPAQIAQWVVEDVWNKGDFRLVNEMFTPGVVLQLPGAKPSFDPGSGDGHR
ncbi:MAG TPA: hypothetical protein VMT20_25410 [Terriglobia bacterium]|nr:hypothetical protein [Terriglobia bacterium]